MADTYTDAKDAVDRLFADTSVSRSITKGRLEKLRDEIDTCLDTLDDVDADDEDVDDDDDDDGDDDDDDDDDLDDDDV